ncbi:MAG TPA: hypothetical protein VGO09_10835 [Flavisolibacter sp.]|nr:hypothetical protein [Flavisolibacter sp.]
MKYLFTFLLAGISFFAVSAQSRDNDEYRRGDNQWQEQSYNRYHGDNDSYRDNIQVRIEQINRVYGHRIWEVKNDYTLSTWQQRRLIHQINEEREDRINALQNWRRRGNWERRKDHEDDRRFKDND